MDFWIVVNFRGFYVFMDIRGLLRRGGGKGRARGCM